VSRVAAVPFDVVSDVVSVTANLVLREISESGVLPTDNKWFLHRNGNNLSLVPQFLGKECAVRYVVEKHLGDEPIWTIGIGDSVTDAGFLREYDFAITPGESQIQMALLGPGIESK
jgi:hypothetical protein